MKRRRGYTQGIYKIMAVAMILSMLGSLAMPVAAQAASRAPVSDTPLALDQAPEDASTIVRISQFYGGGGGSTGYYIYDYVELFNSGTAAVDLTGWSLQYGSATGYFASSAANLYAFPAGTTIQPGKYLLMQMGAAGSVGIALPVTPDLIYLNNFNMSGSSGKVALTNINTALGCGATAAPCTLPHANIIDLIAYGTSNNAEGGLPVLGSGTAGAFLTSEGGVRKGGGCQDTDVNVNDFDVLANGALIPRNSSSPINPICGGSTGPDLTISKAVTPETNVAYHDTVTYTIALTNTTASDITGVAFTDTLPAEVDFGAWLEQPAGANAVADEITWTGDITASTTIDFVFTAIHNGDYGDVVTNTAEFAGASITGTAEAVFTVVNATSDITFVYHDLEDVIETGETLWLYGDFNAWNPAALMMTNDAAYDVFTATVTGLTPGNTYEYKYVLNGSELNGGADLVNTNNRSLTVAGSTTVNDYRNVVVGWANLQWPYTLNATAFINTEAVYGRLWINGVTNQGSPGRGIQAEVGYGNSATPADWDWFPMSFNVDDVNNDEFAGFMTPTDGGVYSYTTRFDGNWGVGNPNSAWTYGDINGNSGGTGFELSQTGVMTVTLYDIGIEKDCPP